MIHSKEQALEIIDKLTSPTWGHPSWKPEKRKLAAALLEAQAGALAEALAMCPGFWDSSAGGDLDECAARLRADAAELRGE